jgi:uncharacterized protein (TIGR02246 family)
VPIPSAALVICGPENASIEKRTQHQRRAREELRHERPGDRADPDVDGREDTNRKPGDGFRALRGRRIAALARLLRVREAPNCVAISEQATTHRGEQMPIEAEVSELYRRLIEGWNANDAEAMAGPIAADGLVIGYDGSQMFGREEIASQLGQIFADHKTATYVAKVRSVKPLGSDAALLHAVVGMVPPGWHPAHA